MKRKIWSFGPARVEIVVDEDADPAEPVVVTRDGKIDAGLIVHVRGPAEVTVTEQNAAWNQPFRRQLLLLPGFVALFWWRLWGLDTWGRLVLVAAVPMALFYVVAVLWAKRERA